MRPLPLAALVALAILPAAAQAAPLGNVAVTVTNQVGRSTGDVPYISSIRLTPGLAVASTDYVSTRARCPARLRGMPRWRASRYPGVVRCTMRARTHVWEMSASYVLWPRRDRSRLTVTVRGI